MRVIEESTPATAAAKRPARSSSVTDWFLARARADPLHHADRARLFFAASSDRFLQADNLTNILRQISPLAIAATGLTFVVLCAEIDLSFANIAALSGIVLAAMHVAGNGTFAVAVALLLAVRPRRAERLLHVAVQHPVVHGHPRDDADRRGLTIKISQGKPYFPPAFTVPSFLRTLGTGDVSVPYPSCRSSRELYFSRVILCSRTRGSAGTCT
jgi:hypothetical protein